MTWVELDFITGQRPPKPRQPTAEELADKEHARLQFRNRAKEKIAHAKLLEDQADAASQAMMAIDEKKEQLAYEHQERVTPWQAELKQAEAKQLEAIRNKKPSDPALDARRVELLGLIREATSELEQAIAAEDHIYAPLAQECYEARMKAGELRITGEGELQRSPNPELNRAQLVARYRFNRAAAHRRSLEDKVKEHPGTFWDDVFSAAEQEWQDAHAETERIVQAIMSE